MQPIEIRVSERTYKTNIKTSWNELNFDELNHVISLLQSPKPHFLEAKTHLALLKLNLFTALTQSKTFPTSDILLEWQSVIAGNEEQRLAFLVQLKTVLDESLAFLFTTIRRFGKDVEVISPDLTRNPMPKLLIPVKAKSQTLKTLYPPSVGKNMKQLNVIGSDIFANMTIYELGTSFGLYEQWVETNSDDTLNALIATIYREKKPTTKENAAKNYGGDVRLPYRGYEATVNQRKDMIARNTPLYIKNMIAFWFGCCRHHFAATYPSVFSGSDGDTNEYGYAGIILELSRSTNSSKNDIADQNAHSTMVELMYEMDRAKAVPPTNE